MADLESFESVAPTYQALRDFAIETPEWCFEWKKGVRMRIDPHHGASLIFHHVRNGDLKLVNDG